MWKHIFNIHKIDFIWKLILWRMFEDRLSTTIGANFHTFVAANETVQQ